MGKGGWVFLVLLLVGRAAWAGDSLIFGVTPQQSAAKLAEAWVPLLEETGRRFGVALTFRTASSVAEFERRVLAGEYDIVYGSPVLYVAAAQVLKARAVARQRQDEQGVLVVRADSPARGLADLKGRIVAFPAASAFGATILTQAALQGGGVTFQAIYLPSDDSVYRAVLDGAADAGGGALRTLTRQDASTREQLRPLMVSQSFAAYPVFVLPRLGAERTAHLQAVLFSLDGDTVGKAVLGRAALLGVDLADDQTYDPVRTMAAEAVRDLVERTLP